MTRAFLDCDAHPARGGPHRSRGLYVGRYFDHPASLVMCTYRSRRGNVCGALSLVPDELTVDGGAWYVPPVSTREEATEMTEAMCVWCGERGGTEPFRFSGAEAEMHPGCAAEARELPQSTTGAEMAWMRSHGMEPNAWAERGER